MTLVRRLPDATHRNVPRAIMSKPTECEQSPAASVMLQSLQESGRAEPVPQGTWSRRIGAAKIAWSRLTYAELEQSDGDVRQLATLLEQRYDLTAFEARRQIHAFLAACGNWS
jgi:hypothetical protein